MSTERFKSYLPRMTIEQLNNSIKLAGIIRGRFENGAQICVDGCCNDNFQPMDPKLSRSIQYSTTADILRGELIAREGVSPGSIVDKLKRIIGGFK